MNMVLCKDYIKIFCAIRSLAGFERKTIYELTSEYNLPIKDVMHFDTIAMATFIREHEKTLKPILSAWALNKLKVDDVDVDPV